MIYRLVVLSFFLSSSAFAALKPGEFYTSGPATSKRIALTFDDGPGPSTEKFLELLDKYHVKATFFVLGELVQYKPDVVKKAVDQGHEIASHTFNHVNYKARYKKNLEELTKMGLGEKEAVQQTKSELLADIKKSDEIIEKVIGHPLTLCRMPNGIDRPWIKEVAKEMGYTLVNWTYGADWTPEPAEKLLPGYLKAIKPGAILLLHDGGRYREKSLFLTEAIIKQALNDGFELVPVGELLSPSN